MGGRRRATALSWTLAGWLRPPPRPGLPAHPAAGACVRACLFDTAMPSQLACYSARRQAGSWWLRVGVDRSTLHRRAGPGRAWRVVDGVGRGGVTPVGSSVGSARLRASAAAHQRRKPVRRCGRYEPGGVPHRHRLRRPVNVAVLRRHAGSDPWRSGAGLVGPRPAQRAQPGRRSPRSRRAARQDQAALGRRPAPTGTATNHVDRPVGEPEALPTGCRFARHLDQQFTDPCANRRRGSRAAGRRAALNDIEQTRTSDAGVHCLATRLELVFQS